MIYFYKTDTQLTIDIVQDIRRLNDMSVKAKQAGMIILGGGVCKHQIANAMLFVRPLCHDHVTHGNANDLEERR
jgi:deoxyhypusine synthase